jgi:metal-responsive CopG/Arc/MetJ family transcriptional regulator
MKVKTSVTLAPEVVEAIDEFADGDGNRSQIIERAVREFLARHARQLREAKDRELLDRIADELNREAEDVLEYQAEP